jgi:hypothetical protein
MSSPDVQTKEGQVAKNVIDPDLRQQALNEIFESLQRESPASPEVKAKAADFTRQTAGDLFESGWILACQEQVKRNKHVAARPVAEVPAVKPVTGYTDDITADLQARRDARRQRLMGSLEQKMANTHAPFDAIHDNVMLKFFTNKGITSATAQKLLAAVKELSK